MIKKSLDLSGQVDLLVPIYRLITTVSAELEIPFFVVGATARDLIWTHGYGFRSQRATHDIDLAVMIKDWEDFDRLEKALLDSGEFNKERDIQRFSYQGRTPIDIVPFGNMEEIDKTISWPPGHDVKMSVMGFDEALDSALIVRLCSDPILDVRVATPAAIVTLKLISWDERYPERQKDAVDIAFMVRGYQGLGNDERLFENHGDLIDDDYDYDTTGAELLGRDIASFLGEQSLERIKNILAREVAGDNDNYRLILDMTHGEYQDSFDENLSLIASLYKGVKWREGA